MPKTWTKKGLVPKSFRITKEENVILKRASEKTKETETTLIREGIRDLVVKHNLPVKNLLK